MSYYILKVPVAVENNLLDNVPSLVKDALIATHFQSTVGRMAGTREFNGEVLILCVCVGDDLQTVIDDFTLPWLIENAGLDVVGADVLDWMNDDQDYDENGDPVGSPTRPLTTPPMTKYLGQSDWNIT